MTRDQLVQVPIEKWHLGPMMKAVGELRVCLCPSLVMPLLTLQLYMRFSQRWDRLCFMRMLDRLSVT